MDNVSYVTKNELEVSERCYESIKNKNTVNLRISSSYPASGPPINITFLDPDDNLCPLCFTGVIFTAFMTFCMGTIAGARTLLGYYATAGVLVLVGILIASCLNSYWRNKTLYGYQVVNELPSNRIDDEDKGGLEIGTRAVQEDEDTETSALTKEYARISLWMRQTLWGYQVATKLPSKRIDDNGDLEMGTRAFQEDDTETLALTEEYDETDLLEIPTIV